MLSSSSTIQKSRNAPFTKKIATHEGSNIHSKLGVALFVAQDDEPNVQSGLALVKAVALDVCAGKGQTHPIAQASTTPFAGSRLDILANSSKSEDVEQDAVPQVKTVFWTAVPMPVVVPQ
jgi:hypothetical protein